MYWCLYPFDMMCDKTSTMKFLFLHFFTVRVSSSFLVIRQSFVSSTGPSSPGVGRRRSGPRPLPSMPPPRIQWVVACYTNDYTQHIVWNALADGVGREKGVAKQVSLKEY